ncbi:MAG: hypothetical protein HY331_10050 [Chloroflexi bacterium]|nr:hypothetical protein [Chloroflexota bacterium]
MVSPRVRAPANYLSLADFARQIGRSANTVREWCSTGRLGDLCMQQDGRWFVHPDACDHVTDILGGEAGAAGRAPSPAARRIERRQRGEPIRAVAERLHIHPETLRAWCSEGKLGDTCFKDPTTRAWMITAEGVRSIQAGRRAVRIGAQKGAEKIERKAKGVESMPERKAEARKPEEGAARTRAKFVPIDEFVQGVDWNHAVRRWCSTGILGDNCHKSPEGNWELKQSAIRLVMSGSAFMGTTGMAERTGAATRPTGERGTTRRAAVTPMVARTAPQGGRMVAGGAGGRTVRQAAGGRGR